MNNRGSILIISYVVIIVLTILGGALVMRSAAENRIAQRHVGSEQALWLAEAGIQQGLWEMNNNNCAGFSPCGTSESSVYCTDCTCGNVDKCLAGTLGTSGDYNVTVNSGNTQMSSTGSFPNRDSAGRLQRGIQVAIKKNVASFFTYAAFGKTNVNLNGDITIDSYDSSKGDYGGSNISSNAEVGTNGAPGIVIQAQTATIIKGNASTGPGGSVLVDGGSQITGSITHNNNVAMPPIVVPEALVNLPSSGSYSVSGGTTTLNAGDYKYTSLIVSRGGKLKINGDVRIYITTPSNYVFKVIDNGTKIQIDSGGSLTIYMEGGAEFEETAVVNSDKNPSLFTLYSKSTSSYALKMDDDAKVYGKIYFPDGVIKLKDDVAVYGSVIGKSVVMFEGSSAIHFDEALKSVDSVGSAAGLYSIYNWQEFQP